jgi:hypothetical protein
MSSIFFGHYFLALCRFNAFISLLSNHLAHLYHVPFVIVETSKVRSTLNKLFRTFEPLLVIISHWCPKSYVYAHLAKLGGLSLSFSHFFFQLFPSLYETMIFILVC